jgi:hypothetical protein
MSDTPVAAALIAAKFHAQNSWQLFTGPHGYDATVPSWKVTDTEDGSPCLSSEVVGESAVHALQRFARDFYLTLPNPGDVRPQFDVTQSGRVVLAWRYDGVWVELWHPDSATDTPQPPRSVRGAYAPPVAAQTAPPSSPAARRAFRRGPSARLPFTRRPKTPKETPTA